jgi:membrane protein DedA with SNARE-associated domain
MASILGITEHFPYLGILLLLVLGDIGLPFPEDTTLILSGLLVAQEVIKPFQTFLVVYVGLLGTDFFLYWVGKKYGRRVVEHKRFRKIISPQKLSSLEKKFNQWGLWVVFFGRHLLGLRAQIFVGAGVMRMSAIKFLMADGTSALFTITLMGGIGYLGGNSIQVLKKDIMRIEHMTILLLVILFAVGIIFWYFKNVRKIEKM